MNESNTRIYYTSDYAMFHFLKGNRDLNEPKINKIVKSVTAGLNFFKYCPIMVNENYFIIDGQHRFYASISSGSNLNRATSINANINR